MTASPRVLECIVRFLLNKVSSEQTFFTTSAAQYLKINETRTHVCLMYTLLRLNISIIGTILLASIMKEMWNKLIRR